MQLHFKADKGQKIIAAILSSHDLHGLCSAFKLLVKAVKDGRGVFDQDTLDIVARSMSKTASNANFS